MQIYEQRRKKLIEKIKLENQTDSGVVLLLSGVEQERTSFVQDSSFYYFTGLNDPGLVLTIDLNGRTEIWKPKYKIDRSAWVVEDNLSSCNFDGIKELGQDFEGYSFLPYVTKDEVLNLIDFLGEYSNIFTLYPKKPKQFYYNAFFIDHLKKYIPKLEEKLKDISLFVAQLRQVKDNSEIELIYKAIDITSVAHEAAQEAIKAGATEAEVQAVIEYVFTVSHSLNAFPSIVASGKNSTVLHYTNNTRVLKNGDSVVVDIGAMYKHYCADITRTYFVGKSSKRQEEIYNLVLQTQEFIQNIARPGMWISNSEKPDQSLNHLAREFLKERGGYDKYFVHGIGHHLGLDVHDLGDYKIPLQKGEVITIEPGIYIPEEEIGVRIEDDYWLVEDGVVCLSQDLSK